MDAVIRNMPVSSLRGRLFAHTMKGRRVYATIDWLGVWINVEGFESFHITFDNLASVLIDSMGRNSCSRIIRVGYIAMKPETMYQYRDNVPYPKLNSISLGEMRSFISIGAKEGSPITCERMPYDTCFLRTRGACLALIHYTIPMINDTANHSNEITIPYMETQPYIV